MIGDLFKLNGLYGLGAGGFIQVMPFVWTIHIEHNRYTLNINEVKTHGFDQESGYHRRQWHSR